MRNRRRRRRRRFTYRNEVIAGLVLIVLALLIFFGVRKLMNSAPAEVTLSVNDFEMRQDAELPPMQVQANATEKDMKCVLDKKSGYTVADFISDVNAGKSCFVEHEADVSVEGTYALKVKFDSEMTEKISAEWNKKLKLIFEEGTLLVKNKYGDWEGTKFKLIEEGYASGWMDIQNHTYYFGEDGNYVTGECKVDGKAYYFREDGKFDTEKNKVNPSHPVVALTFDDGPGPFTEELLNGLEEHGVKATFFMLGTRVKAYPSLVKRMLEMGCELGNHSTNHPELTKISASEVAKEINTTNQAIKKACDQSASLVRPPYGSINQTVRNTIKAPLILWSVDTLDWKTQNVEMIKEEIRSKIKDGDIILMHDIYQTTVTAILELLPELQEEGYQFLTVSELAEYRGVDMKNGEKYRSFYK